MCLSLTYSLPLYLSISPSLSLSLCLSLPLFIFLVLYLSFTSPSHLPSSSHHDRSVSVPTSLFTLGLLHSFLHHLSFHIYLLSHKHMNTITAAIFQLEVLGTAIANPMPPKPFCLQIDSYGMGRLLARIGCEPRGSQRENWLRTPQRFAARSCYSCRCRCRALPLVAAVAAASRHCRCRRRWLGCLFFHGVSPVWPLGSKMNSMRMQWAETAPVGRSSPSLQICTRGRSNPYHQRAWGRYRRLSAPT